MQHVSLDKINVLCKEFIAGISCVCDSCVYNNLRIHHTACLENWDR